MTDMLTAYRADLHARRLAEATITVRLLVAGILARRYDLATMTTNDLAEIEQHQWTRRSPQTQRSYRQHTRDLCAWMVQAGVRGDDPSVALHLPRVARGRPRPMPEDDLELALAAGGEELRTWVALAAFAGLRCVEIASLDRADITGDTEPELRVRGKGGKERVVPIGGGLLRE
ncbi:MAG: site-specific integrase, partial [Streptosporangiales bacterium]